jgi:hypothetical protein
MLWGDATMHATKFLLAATCFAIPQPLTAAGIAISCVLTTEDILFASAEPPTPIRREIEGTTNFTIADSALVTAMASPCDRIEGGIGTAKIDVSCSFPTDNNTQASIRIQIDRELGAISEIWDITEYDGSKVRHSLAGTCMMGGIG